MSVILDALKKLDREKSSRKGTTANIAAEILKPDLPPPGKRFPLNAAILSVTVVATAVITYAMLVEFGFLQKESPPAPDHSPAPSQKSAPAPMEPSLPSESSFPEHRSSPGARQEVQSTPAPHQQVRDTKDEMSQVPLKIETPPEGKIPVESKPSIEIKSPATSVDERKAIHKVPTKEGDAAPASGKKPDESLSSGSATSPPSLKLSAIVWYEERSQSFAMINGIRANEGSVIEGVKVVEIHPTSVRFFYNSQYFEISISK